MPLDSSTGFYAKAESPPRIIDDAPTDSSNAGTANPLTPATEKHETVVGKLPERNPNLPRRSELNDAGFVETQRERFEIIKHWEAIVTAVETRSFFAMARSVESDNERAEDEIEIDLENVLPSERDLVREGAVFYLIVGTRYPTGSRPEKITKLIFRRMPRWSAGDIQRAKSVAEKLWEAFNFDSHESTGQFDLENRKAEIGKR
jgi:hypothetical protein